MQREYQKLIALADAQSNKLKAPIQPKAPTKPKILASKPEMPQEPQLGEISDSSHQLSIKSKGISLSVPMVGQAHIKQPMAHKQAPECGHTLWLDLGSSSWTNKWEIGFYGGMSISTMAISKPISMHKDTQAS